METPAERDQQKTPMLKKMLKLAVSLSPRCAAKIESASKTYHSALQLIMLGIAIFTYSAMRSLVKICRHRVGGSQGTWRKIASFGARMRHEIICTTLEMKSV